MATTKTSRQKKLEALARSNPAEYRKIVARQKARQFTPHSEGQRQLRDDDHRFIWVRAGRRYGKTKVAARRLIRKALKNPDAVVWWVANTYKNTRRGYREVLRQLPPEFLAHTPPPATSNDLIVELTNGSRIEFYSSTNPDAMAGEGVTYVVVDEAALQAETAWTQIIRPTLMDHGGGAFLISTPRGRNWFWHGWTQAHAGESANSTAYHFTSMDNPLIDPDEWIEAKKTLPDLVYRQEILAEFLQGEGAIFRFGDGAIIDQLRSIYKGQQVVMGVDLAKHQDFTVMDAVTVEGRYPVFHDRFNSVAWPVQQDRIVTAVHEIESWGAGQVTVVLDSTGVGDVVYDNLEETGLDIIPVKFSQQWKNQAVRLLSADLERGIAHILPEQVEEFEAYEYQISPKGIFTYGAPEGGHDDEVAAKLMQNWGIVNEILMEAHVSTFDVTGEAEIEPDEILEIEARSTLELMNDPAVWGH